MQEVKGRTAVVTGGANGVGLAMAIAFAEAGMNVAIADIDEDCLRISCGRLAALGGKVYAARLDVTDRLAWEREADQIENAIGPVQLLCNNAGMVAPGWDVGELPPKLWDRMIGINLTGVFNGCHCFIPRMKARKAEGHIVNTCSISGLRARGGHAGYIASKHAVLGLSDALRCELSEHGIGVTVLCPGAVRSNLAHSSQRIREQAGVSPAPDAEIPTSEDPNALDAAWFGRRVLRAVRENEFFVLTHPEYRPFITGRFDELEAASDKAAQLAAEANYVPQKPH